MDLTTEAIFELDHISTVLGMVSDNLTIVLESLGDELQSAKESHLGATIFAERSELYLSSLHLLHCQLIEMQEKANKKVDEFLEKQKEEKVSA